MSLSCFGSEYKMAEHFTCFTANNCLVKTWQLEQQEDNSTDDISAIWSIFADLNSSLSPKPPNKHALPR